MAPPTNATEKQAAERRSNMLLGFSGALRNSAIGPTIDTQRVVAALGTLLGRPGRDGVVALQPLHDMLIQDLKVNPLDAAGILLFIKGGEARYGVSTELPTAVANLPDADRTSAIARFSTRRAGVSDISGSYKTVTPESSKPVQRPTAPTADTNPIKTQPLKAAATFAAVFGLVFIVAIPMGVGAKEAGWSITLMWGVRHALLAAGGVVALALLSTSIGAGFRSMFAGGPGLISAVALVGGLGLGFMAQVVAPSAPRDASFVMPVVVLAGIMHVISERFFFHVVQQGLGRGDAPLGLVGVIAMQCAWVFTYAIVVQGSGGEMAMWMGYAFITSAGPTAFLGRNGSLWPSLAWQLGFTFANIGVAAS